MIGYVIRRLGVAIVVTFGIAAITFLMLHYLSPSPVYDVLGPKANPRRSPLGTRRTATTARRSRSSSPTWAISLT